MDAKLKDFLNREITIQGGVELIYKKNKRKKVRLNKYKVNYKCSTNDIEDFPYINKFKYLNVKEGDNLKFKCHLVPYISSGKVKIKITKIKNVVKR
jgi:hypothetical protein